MPLHIPLRVQIYHYQATEVVHSHDAEISELGGAYAKNKEITVGWLFGHDKVKVAFDLKSENVELYPVYGRLYVNDVEKGAVQTEGGTEYVTKIETLSGIEDEDTIQLYLHGFPGKNLISADYTANRIYVHSGITGEIVEYFSSPGGDPKGLAYDGVNIISCDSTSNRIYVHDGISNTIDRYFSSPGGYPAGLAYDGVNLISCDRDTGRIYLHEGITEIITRSFLNPGTQIASLTYAGVNLISSDFDTHLIYVHEGITEIIDRSFLSPQGFPTGLAYDGVNLISSDYSVPDTIFVHEGISETIKRSFDAPWSGINALTCYDALTRAYARNLRIIGRVEPMTEKAAVFENTL